MRGELLGHVIRTTIKKVRGYSLPVVVSIGAGAAVVCFGSTAGATIRQTHVAFELHPAKVAALKADLVDRLMACESGGYSEADGIIVFDSNGKASIGPAQFQQTTVIHYQKRLYGEEITGKEAVEIALDRARAAKLAQDIIFTTDKGLRNWFNCAKKLELAPEVALLKELARLVPPPPNAPPRAGFATARHGSPARTAGVGLRRQASASPSRRHTT